MVSPAESNEYLKLECSRFGEYPNIPRVKRHSPKTSASNYFSLRNEIGVWPHDEYGEEAGVR